LLLTALVFIGDLVTFITSFLQGELTLRFALNCLVTFLLAGAVFLYYSRALGKSRVLPPVTWHRLFAAAAGAVILLPLGLGFSFNGSPAKARLASEDKRRARDLYGIALRIEQVTHGSGTFSPPANLLALKVAQNDPFTGQLYEYNPLGGRQYKLCAQFGTASRRGGSSQFWRHASGRQCFDFETTQAPDYPSDSYR